MSPQHIQSKSQTHGNIIQTRLKTGASQRKYYKSFLAALPKLSSLLFIDVDLEDNNDHISCGFSFLADIHEIDEPKNFRVASSVVQWQKAMQEEYDTLKAHGT